MRVGTWRDVDLSTYARGALWAAGLTAAAVAVPEGLGWLAIGPVLCGALVAILMRVRGGAARLDQTGETHALHPGPNSSRIPVAGLPGLALVLGFVWMFWFGVPAFRPVVIAIAIVGGLAGILLIWVSRRRQAPPSTILNMRPEYLARKGSEAEAAAVRETEHSRLPQNKEMKLTGGGRMRARNRSRGVRASLFSRRLQLISVFSGPHCGIE